ncbi:hypothetical protein [Haloprofundus salilacus]|uniref:hypothetical protein n=1 Tax=Haloprofundus salilacus TaxID=2876190 RepID=UPI001CC93467|nr:hypothetical protein [Haloprofundus salilacus]
MSIGEESKEASLPLTAVAVVLSSIVAAAWFWTMTEPPSGNEPELIILAVAILTVILVLVLTVQQYISKRIGRE